MSSSDVQRYHKESLAYYCFSLVVLQKKECFFIQSLFKMSNVLQYPCVVCDEECHEDTISCCNCEDWVHIACVPMSKDLLDQ